jgi:hypothetical protein
MMKQMQLKAASLHPAHYSPKSDRFPAQGKKKEKQKKKEHKEKEEKEKKTLQELRIAALATAPVSRCAWCS